MFKICTNGLIRQSERLKLVRKLCNFNGHSLHSKGVKATSNQLEDNEARSKLNSAIKEGEKLVVYPTSFLNLRWLLNDEIAQTAMQVRNLMVTDHPLVNTLRKLISETGTSIWSLIILLISKANQLNTENHKSIAGILPEQRVLAEIVQMIRVSHLLHDSVYNSKPDHITSLINTGNKLTLLGGDHLLSQVFKALADMRNSIVNELMSVACRNLFESNFVGARDFQNRPLPSKPMQFDCNVTVDDKADMNPFEADGVLGHAQPEWTLRNSLGGGNLLGKSCQAALVFAEKTQQEQALAYFFGNHFALAEKARHDSDIFSGDDFSAPFSLVSAPVLFHLQDDPELYSEIEKGLDSVDNVNYQVIWGRVKSGNGLKRTKELQKKHLSEVYKITDTFVSSDAKDSLIDIVRAVEINCK